MRKINFKSNNKSTARLEPDSVLKKIHNFIGVGHEIEKGKLTVPKQ